MQLRFDSAVMCHAESERPRTARKSSRLQTKIPLPSAISAPGEPPEKRESFALSRGTFLGRGERERKSFTFWKNVIQLYSLPLLILVCQIFEHRPAIVHSLPKFLRRESV